LSESNLPNWYISPKQNNADFLYGVAEGFSLEEATRNSLAECAARLMVSVSSESQLTRQADNSSAHEEIRQKTLQSVEKINFLNYSVSRSSKVNDRFYVEVKVEKTPFFNDQKERVEILRKKIELPVEVKELGTYTVIINLHREVIVNVEFEVSAE
jgi:large subunit ribosomal protein L9